MMQLILVEKLNVVVGKQELVLVVENESIQEYIVEQQKQMDHKPKLVPKH